MATGKQVRNNEQASRYEMETDEGLCFAAYEQREGAILFTHTEVPEAAEGKGYASRLIDGAFADVRARGLKLVPLCAFVAAYVDRHPETQDLLATAAPG